MESHELMEGGMNFKGRKKDTTTRQQDGKDRVQKEQRKINQNNSQNEKEKGENDMIMMIRTCQSSTESHCQWL